MKRLFMSMMLLAVIFTTIQAQIIVKNSSQQEVMRILDNGNVGIGTSQPSAQLHTTGSVRFAGVGVGSTSSSVLQVDALGTVSKRTLVNGADTQALSVGAGAINTSLIKLTRSVNDVTLEAGTNMTLAESGNTITL